MSGHAYERAEDMKRIDDSQTPANAALYTTTITSVDNIELYMFKVEQLHHAS